MDDNKNSALRILQDVTKVGDISLATLAKAYNLTRSQLRYRLRRINDYLSDRGLQELIVTADTVSAPFSWQEVSSLFGREQGNEFMLDSLNSQMRRSAEVIYIFCASEALSVFHFQSAFKISKNTVIGDLKQIRETAAEHAVTLQSSRQYGYYFLGSRECIRNFVLMNIDRIGSIDLFSFIVQTVLGETCPIHPQQIVTRLVDLLTREHIPYLIEYLNRSACLFSLLLLHGGKDSARCEQMYSVSQGTRVWKLARMLIDDLEGESGSRLDENEMSYVALLIGYISTDADLLQELITKPLFRLERIARELLCRFSLIMNVQKPADEALVQELSRHLLFASFCIQYHFPIVFPKLLLMKRKYIDVYNIVNMLLRSTPEMFEFNVCEGETAFIASHLLKLLDVKDSGNGTPVKQNRSDPPDSIRDSDNEADSVNICMQRLSNYCDFRDEAALSNLLRNLSASERKMVVDLLSPPELRKVLKPEFIQMMDNCPDWKSAVQIAAQPLIERGLVMPEYVDEMINLALSQGPYYKVFPEILIPHAYSSSVRKLCFSLLHLKRPVYLLGMEEHPIKVVIVVAALDNKLHQKALGTLANLLSEDGSRKLLLEARKLCDITDLLYK